MNSIEIIAAMQAIANPDNLKGMERYAINTENTLGLSMPEIRKIAKEVGKNHETALELWNSGIHEAKILAGLIELPKSVSEEQMEDWVMGFDSWDVCDQVVMNLFDKTPFAWKKAVEWTAREEEFVKRAGFAMMASLAVHDKKAADSSFIPFFELIYKCSDDDRNFVKKAVNWALRQIGKRNRNLSKLAIETAEKIRDTMDEKSARWIASDALRELNGENVNIRN